MKNSELFMLKEKLRKVGKLKGVKFAYAIAKNVKMLEEELAAIKKAIEPSEEFAKLDDKRIELAKKYADKKNGNPVIKDGNFVMNDNKKERLEKELEKIKKANKKAYDERDKQVKEYNEFLEKESSFKPYMIDLNDVPAEITVEEMDAVKDLIK